MEKQLEDFFVGKTHELMEANSCCKEAREAGEAFLKALNTPQEKEVTKAFLKELEKDITPIDGLIHFASSDHAKEAFGEKQAQALYEHAQQIKAQGAQYCDCPACSAAVAIVEKKEAMLA